MKFPVAGKKSARVMNPGSKKSSVESALAPSGRLETREEVGGNLK